MQADNVMDAPIDAQLSRAQLTSHARKTANLQKVKSTAQPRVETHPLPAPQRPFQAITMDWLYIGKSTGTVDSVLNIVDKFSKWAIIIPCDKHMDSEQLCQTLYEHAFSWTGLPESIVGDRDSRLRAHEVRALCDFLQVRLKLSVAYHPQTDGATEVFNKTLLQLLKTQVNARHTDWVELLPALQYAYHNTVHMATGFTPHFLLMGWSPRDLRAPLSLQMSSQHGEIDQWLERRRKDFQRANVSLERARSAMISAQKASAKAHKYTPGALVKVSTRVLPLRPGSTQLTKLLQSWIGPLRVEEAPNPGVVRLKLPSQYVGTSDTFSVHDIRPWLSHESHEYDPNMPAVQVHPAHNRVLQIVGRKRLGRAQRKPEHLLDIPAQYFCKLVTGELKWIPFNHFYTSDERAVVRNFEATFKRTSCRATLKDYAEELRDEGYESPDEVDVELYDQLRERWRE